MSSVVSPAEWGAAVGYDSWSDPAVLKDKVVVHYNGPEVVGFDRGAESEKSVLRAIERYHLGKGWRGIAYGWAVGASGTVYRLRGWNIYGAHTGDVDHDGVNENREAIPVLFMLGGRQDPTPAMLGGFKVLYQGLCDDERSIVGPLPVLGHRDVSSTECPGDIVYKLIEDKFWIGDDSVLTPSQEKFLAVFAEKSMELDPSASGSSYPYLLTFYRGLALRYGIPGNRPGEILDALAADLKKGEEAVQSLARIRSVLS